MSERLSRREFMRLAALVAAAASAGACAPIAQQLAGAPQAASGMPVDNRHFQALSRLTYGPRLDERLWAAEHGLAAYIEEQLATETIADDSADFRLRPLDAIRLQADELDGWEPEEALQQLRQATLLRRVYSRRQLYERMVEFWSDHFNISVAKPGVWMLKIVDDREVIRRHAFGRFGDLLQASAHSPAMLVYLDNHANHKAAPNENYARELLELHTLGVNGGYSQQDVMELARCLTGWTVKQHWWPHEFTFDPERHDDGVKRVLGAVIAADGEAEAAAVIDRLAVNRRTAEFIGEKLVRRFICDDPQREAADLVVKTADAFQRTQGDLRQVMRTVLLDGVVARAGRLPPKFKRPSDFVASSLRLSGAETRAPAPLHEALRAMGQRDFDWPTPDGPPDTADAWINNLLPRWQLAVRLARDGIDGVRIEIDPEEPLTRLSERLLGGSYRPIEQVIAQLKSSDAAEKQQILLAGLIASPAFQWR